MLTELKFYGGCLYRPAGYENTFRVGQPRVQVIGGVPAGGAAVNTPNANLINAAYRGGTWYYVINVSGSSITVFDGGSGNTLRVLPNNQACKLHLGTAAGHNPVFLASAALPLNAGRAFGSNSATRTVAIGVVPAGLIADADAGPTADDCDIQTLLTCTPFTLFAFVHPGAGGAVQATDLSSLFAAGAIGPVPAGTVWRLIEVGGNLTYASGTVGTDGTLGGCTLGVSVGANTFNCATNTFTSDYTHAGFMQLQIGCPGPVWPTASG